MAVQSTTNNWANKIYLFSFGKSFWKKKKTIEGKCQKQIDALENLKDQNKQLVNDEEKLLLSKERETFTNIYNKRLDKIEELTKKIDGNNLMFTTLSTRDTIDFSKKEII